MARLSQRLPGNAPGDLFVDSSCIACDTCRRLAPEVFGGDEEETAFVAGQPASATARRRALMALVACPVSAIGLVRADAAGVAAAARGFPAPVEGAPGVHDCGFAAESSFGAASWLVVRPGGNVLVDSPRFSRPLLERVRALGGARWMFLTHRDDVADHARWAAALGCARVLHERDVSRGTRDVERPLRGDDPIELADGLLAVPVPGHTAGSCALLDRQRHLFTGDHLWGDAAGELGAGRSICWHDWGEQTRSMARVATLPFTWVFPGHGRPWRAPSPSEARAAVERLVAEMRR